MDTTHIDYNRADPAVEARVAALLAQMTLAEKVGQLVQGGAFEPLPPEEAEQRAQAAAAEGRTLTFQDLFRARTGIEHEIRSGAIGSLLNIADPQLVNRLQRIAIEETRLGIPLIIGSDVIHGFRTIFPIPLAESCTWNPALLEQAARVAAEEASAHGVDWIFAPMVDVSRDPRWGRVAEGAGEDVLLGAVLAQARVRGFQAADLASGRRVVACPKHYVAYGAAEGGRDYNTVDVSERTLREIFLPPFQAAFAAGAGSVMSSFNEIAGVPVSASRHALRTLLRDEWQWPGVVLSDYEAVRELIPHGVAADLADAARLAIMAGIDMDMMAGAYANHLTTLVEAGVVPVALIDEAVARVLRLKFLLGLFEHPYVDPALGDQLILQQESRTLALTVAQQSMVLLANNGVLPLAAGTSRIAVVGALADARRDMLGCWTLFGRESDVETILEGIQAAAGAASVTYTPGCPARGDGPADLAAAVAAAQAADVVIAVLGEDADMSGEARSRAQLRLPGRQHELLDALAATGTPIVGVLVTGRPLVVPRVTEQVAALLVAWHGGIRAGRAVADILFGVVNPSGRLTMSWPRDEGQIPVYYNHKNTGRPMEGTGVTQFSEPFKSRYIDMPNEPLFPFGHGLSYTSFAYRDLTIDPPTADINGTLVVSATIANTGERRGEEVVQLYVRDLIGSVTRPVKELKGFQRIALAPGASQTVRFVLRASDLGYIGHDLRRIVEPGMFHVWIGPDSATGVQGSFEII
ncbi:MAG TPA: beta-glucosidase BglX [Roseiflexaceae bacterium]|nr:beta-glucosidase BglX [Roseiflexaceae bacterium]